MRTLEHRLALGLGDAAGDPDGQIAAPLAPIIAHPAQPSELGIDLLGGLLANVAGVQDDQISFFRALGTAIAMARQQGGHAVAVIDVHLTAIGLDEELLGHAASTTTVTKKRKNNSA